MDFLNNMDRETNGAELVGRVKMENGKAVPFSDSPEDVRSAAAYQRYLDGEFTNPFTAMLTIRQEAGETEFFGEPIGEILSKVEAEDSPYGFMEVDETGEDETHSGPIMCPAEWAVGASAIQWITDQVEYRADKAMEKTDVMELTELAIVAKFLVRLNEFWESESQGREAPSFEQMHEAVQSIGFNCEPAKTGEGEGRNGLMELLRRMSKANYN